MGLLRHSAALLLFLSLPLVAWAEELWSENFGGSISDWKILPGCWEVTDGYLRSTIPEGTKNPGCRTPGFPGGADRVAFRFRLAGADELQFKVNHTGGGHLFRLIIRPEGYRIRVNRNAQIPIEEAFNTREIAAELGGDGWHELALEIEGEDVAVSINGGDPQVFSGDSASEQAANTEPAPPSPRPKPMVATEPHTGLSTF